MKSPSSQSVSNGVTLSNGQQNGHLKSFDRHKARANKNGRIDSTNFHPPSNGNSFNFHCNHYTLFEIYRSWLPNPNDDNWCFEFKLACFHFHYICFGFLNHSFTSSTQGLNAFWSCSPIYNKSISFRVCFPRRANLILDLK